MQNELDPTKRSTGLSTPAMYALTALRIAIGWHFLYEGIAKLLEPNWTSASYLWQSKWILSDVFHWMADNPAALRIVDLLNIWGLILIGLALFVGLFSRLVCFLGIGLLGLYYLANPALTNFAMGGTEGNYLFIDKTLVELIALVVLLIVPTGKFLGLDGLIKQSRQAKAARDTTRGKVESPQSADLLALASLPRRAVLKHLAALPLLGGFAYACLKKHSHEEKQLAGRVAATTSATIKTFEFSSLEDLQGQIPHAPIGGLQVSRIMLGGNLIGGWAHSRDLIYVSKLIKTYHSERKIFETLYLAEQCGINAIIICSVLSGIIKEYRKRRIGKIQFIADCGGDDFLERMKGAVDDGADACYIQGAATDSLVSRGKMDLITTGFAEAKRNGWITGIGGHSIGAIKACAEQGLKPDFWMKTLHHHDYWSAKHPQGCDNIFCPDPSETIAYMNALEQPWIAFKVLAAGAIQPQQGFKFAFENGADFVCVGMYDFQVVENANITLDILNNPLNRERPWRA